VVAAVADAVAPSAVLLSPVARDKLPTATLEPPFEFALLPTATDEAARATEFCPTAVAPTPEAFAVFPSAVQERAVAIALTPKRSEKRPVWGHEIVLPVKRAASPVPAVTSTSKALFASTIDLSMRTAPAFARIVLPLPERATPVVTVL
jgi:hypothetical protein